MISTSLKGSTDHSTWETSGSLKYLSTCTITSTSRICDKNLFHNHSPLDAPLTKPAISTNDVVA